ncbi:hypothetical protein XENOCAPTIV_005125 [Xenoophorus captivus]|uniref:Uncharacterized protein n=1 Tax=Xenoophorus captivus TaxID=1517983 RepID=A0ABV0QMA3_9TELE
MKWKFFLQRPLHLSVSVARYVEAERYGDYVSVGGEGAALQGDVGGLEPWRRGLQAGRALLQVSLQPGAASGGVHHERCPAGRSSFTCSNLGSAICQALVNGSLGGAMASVHEGGGAGPVCLPRRAETFGGFDSHQMHGSKSKATFCILADIRCVIRFWYQEMH